jgi:hypothetical protein
MSIEADRTLIEPLTCREEEVLELLGLALPSVSSK